MSDPEIQRGPAPAGARDASLGERILSEGCLGRGISFLVVVFGLAYLANPTLGFFELIPDNLPGVGNLDEAGITALLLLALRNLFKKRTPPPAG